MSDFPHLAHFKDYIPGKTLDQIALQIGFPLEKLVKLNSNENAFGFSPKILGTIVDYLSSIGDLNLYPAALGDSLVKSLKLAFPQIGAGEVVVGNGMDDIIEAITRMVLCPGDQVLIHTPTFEYYALASQWQKASLIEIATDPADDFAIPISKILAHLNRSLRLVFLCSPNNPTGQLIPEEVLREIIEESARWGTVVFLDEAYAEYAGVNYLSWPANYDNLIVGRTFSKIYGLAGLRIGWAVLSPTLLVHYRKVQTPFAVNKLALLAASTALEDKDFVENSVRENITGRDFLEHTLSELGFQVFSSQANFISLRAGERFGFSGQKLCRALLQYGVMVRDTSVNQGAPSDLVRITVGTQPQNWALIEAITAALAQA